MTDSNSKHALILFELFQAKEKELDILRAEIDLLRNIIVLIPGNIFWKDKSGEYLGCNNNLAQILGFKSPKEIIGKRNEDFLEPELAKIATEMDEKTINFGKELFIEESGLTFNNQPAVYLSKKLPLFNAEGEVIGLLGAAFDISDRKKMEADLQNQKDKAEAVSQHKSDFISNMSHDIKTPLSGIIGVAELLTNKLKEKENSELAKAIYASGNQLLDFFSDCLEVFKLKDSDYSDSISEFSLPSVFNKIYATYLPAVQVKNLEFNIHYDNQIPHNLLIGNVAILHRILLNLIGNAIKFTQMGSITIQINLKESLPDNKIIIEFIIADTGLGIPNKKQHIIFDQFVKLTPSSKGLFQGSGMGLYLVKNYVNTMQGNIFLESQEGLGSKFIVHLPFYISETISKENTINSFSSLDLQNQDNFQYPAKAKKIIDKKLKILLVEDNVTARLVAYSILSSINCEVEVADSGEKALEMLNGNHYDLIFMDCGLPGMQGNEVADYIRTLEQGSGKRIPIVMLTAHVMGEEKEIYGLAVDDFISKPLSKSKAHAMLKKHFIFTG